MKKIILITLFSIGIYGMNAQCECDGPVQTHTFYAIPNGSSTQEWYGTVKYTANSDGSACIVSITSNPKIYWGDIPMNTFITGLMDTYGLEPVKIPASCYSPVLTKVPSGDGPVSFYVFTPCSAGCCIIDRSNVRTIFGVGGPRPECTPGCYTICD
jgi:hypothetical protein